MRRSVTHILVVDDLEVWRRFAAKTLQKEPTWKVISEASDGLEAVRKAQELHPDLILLDIGLPTLNGIEAARRIREVSPASKILFVSENRSIDIVKEALSTGAGGYVLKSDASGELLPAVRAVLEGKQFISDSLGHGLNGPPDPQTGARFHRENVATLNATQRVGSARHHEAEFYSDVDRDFLNHVTLFLGAALKAGNAVVIVATTSHRESLRSELQAHGIDVHAAVEQGRYIDLDTGDTLSSLMVNGKPDPVRFLELFGDLIVTATEAAKGASPRVWAFSEFAPVVLAQGNPEAAIQIEKLANKLTQIHDLKILCGYSLGSFENVNAEVFQRICAEHSAVYSQ